MNLRDRIEAALAGRRDMNRRTAALHPDHAVREAATLRAAAYDLALGDCQAIFEAERERLIRATEGA